MDTTSHRLRPIALLLTCAALVLGLGACSSDDGDDDASSDDSTTTSGKVVNQGAIVEIEDFKFTPPDITVKAGELITWENHGSQRHTVTQKVEIGAERDLRSDPILIDESFSVTLDTPGTYTYNCSFHGDRMTGKVTVE